jgi:hypothetical protein
MAVFVRTEWGRPELERALRFGDRAMCLEQLVMFAGAGRGDEMPLLIVAVPGMVAALRCGMADHRPGRGVARGAPCCGDEEWGDERGGEKTGESHERPLCGYRGIPMRLLGLRDLHENSGPACAETPGSGRCLTLIERSRRPTFMI